MPNQSRPIAPIEVVTRVVHETVTCTIPGDPPGQTPRPHRCINSYAVVAPYIGHGATGIVNLVVDRTTGHRFAMKEVSRENGRYEVEIFRRINGHPNIVRMYALLDDGVSPEVALILEYMAGGVVMELSGTGHSLSGTLSESQVRQYISQIIPALRHVHECLVMHGDIKPGNIYASDDRMTVKLADFGCAQVVRDRCGSGDVITLMVGRGTPTFLPPEIVNEEEVPVYGYAQDMWALGLTMYVMLYGCLPFPAEGIRPYHIAVATMPMPFPNQLISSVVLAVLERLTAKDPQRRMTVSELCDHVWITAIDSPVAEHDKLEGIVRLASFSHTPTKGALRATFRGSPLILPRQERRTFSVMVADESGASRAYTLQLIAAVVDTSTRDTVTVTVAIDGAELIRHALSRHFDLILMDIHMLHHNGFEATHAIRQKEFGGEERSFIMGMTSDSHSKIAQYCQVTGMSEMMRKPVTLEKIRAVCLTLGFPTKVKNGVGTDLTRGARIPSAAAQNESVPTYGIDKMIRKFDKAADRQKKAVAACCVAVYAMLKAAAASSPVSSPKSPPRIRHTAGMRPIGVEVTSTQDRDDDMLLPGIVFPMCFSEMRMASNETEFDSIVMELEQYQRESERVLAVHAVCFKETEMHLRRSFLCEIEKVEEEQRSTKGVSPPSRLCSPPSLDLLLPNSSRAPSAVGSRPMTPFDHQKASLFLKSARKGHNDMYIPCSPIPTAIAKALAGYHGDLTNFTHDDADSVYSSCVFQQAPCTHMLLSPKKKVTQVYPCVVVASTIGARPTMEDVVSVLPHLCRLYGHSTMAPDHYLAVLDGHSGDEAAVYADRHLHYHFIQNANFVSDPGRALHEAFMECNAAFMTKASRVECNAGAAVVVAYLRGTMLYVANAGDCMAVVSDSHGNVLFCTRKHDTSNADEVAAVVARGGEVISFMGGLRVNGRLLLTRALGDAPDSGVITCEPDVDVVNTEGAAFVVLATDGLWNASPPSAVCAAVAAMRTFVDVGTEGFAISEIAAALVHDATDQWLSGERATTSPLGDNIAVAILFF